MLITGAGGHSKELLDILTAEAKAAAVFFDDYTKNSPLSISDVPVCTDIAEAIQIIKTNPAFVLGTGNGKLRAKFAQIFTNAGGTLTSVIASSAFWSSQGTTMGAGANIMAFAFISAEVTIGEGCLINTRVNIHHNTSLGAYCEISPAATLLGNVTLGDFVTVGSGAIILPGITIADNATIGAGAVVTKNVAAGVTVVGNPAKEI
jgi:sugar O-acyltransferase (sialic acid O-acetyltransferase NeuD family)